MKTMPALIKQKPQEGLWPAHTQEPSIGNNEVLIHVLQTGICGTDLHIYKWDAWAQKTIPVPLIVGHEFVGRIVAVGANVKDFQPGEIVSGEGHVVCGQIGRASCRERVDRSDDGGGWTEQRKR